LGRKQIGTGQCLHVFIACLIITLFSGCATLSDFSDRMAAKDDVRQGERLFQQGDFTGASKQNLKAISLSGMKSPGDRALFNLGVIYAHQDNPERSYKRSLKYFSRMMKAYPDSPLYHAAEAWYFLLNSNIKANARIEILSSINGYLMQNDELIEMGDFKKALELNQKALSVSGDGHRQDEVLYNIGLIYAHYDNPDKNYRLANEYFERLIKEYPESPLVVQAKIWKGLLDVIEKSKQVDIEIDQKKKEMAR
jgi:tetratricopeptide (TPR) repeat protein